MKFLKITSIALCWIVWLLFVVPALYNTGKAIQLSSIFIPKGEWQLTYTLILAVSIVMTIVTFGLKWLFHWIVQRFTDANTKTMWTYLLLPLFGFCIWFISFPIYFYGLVIFFQSHALSYYFVFAILSFVILVLHAPCFVIPKTKTEQDATSDPYPGAINRSSNAP